MKRKILKFLQFLNNLFTGSGISKIPKIVSLYEFLYKLSKPDGLVLIESQGNKMYLNADDNGVAPSLLRTGAFEPFETELIKTLVTKDMTVVNIGANIGYYTLIVAQIVGSNGRVFAFEPTSQNYQILVKNIQANDYKNIIPIQAAVSNKQGIKKLFINKTNLATPSFSKKNVGTVDDFLEVETNSLDTFIEIYDKELKVDIIIMDTQGGEGLILDGAQKIISQNSLKIIMEFWPYGLANIGTDALSLLKKMENSGFNIKHIDEVNKSVDRVSLEKIIEMCMLSKGGRGYVNNLLLEKQ